MSVQAVEAVILKAKDDATYRALLHQNPDLALHGYDLTIPEREALVAGDETKLQQLGIPHDLAWLAAGFNRGEHLPGEQLKETT